MENQRGVYIISDLSSGKAYIGATIKKQVRLKKHDQTLKSNKHHNKNLQEAYNNGNKLNLLFIPVSDDVNPFNCEKELISDFRKENVLYNIVGGMEPSSIGRIVSLETREKQRQAKLGTKQSTESIQKRADANRGQKRSIESRQNMSNGQLGNINFLGKKHSDETKDLMSKRALELGRVISKEALKISAELRSIPVMIDNVKYNSINEAANKYNVSGTCITYRIKSDNWPTWYYL